MTLSDAQYLEILYKIRNIVNGPNFVVCAVDSTEIGNKYTESNCGMCNDNFTDEDMALFPDQYPSRKTMKYRAENHKCPFDERKIGDFSMGCFYDCYIFNTERGKHKVKNMRKKVESTIQEAEKWQK